MQPVVRHEASARGLHPVLPSPERLTALPGQDVFAEGYNEWAAETAPGDWYMVTVNATEGEFKTSIYRFNDQAAAPQVEQSPVVSLSDITSQRVLTNQPYAVADILCHDRLFFPTLPVGGEELEGRHVIAQGAIRQEHASEPFMVHAGAERPLGPSDTNLHHLVARVVKGHAGVTLLLEDLAGAALSEELDQQVFLKMAEQRLERLEIATGVEAKPFWLESALRKVLPARQPNAPLPAAVAPVLPPAEVAKRPTLTRRFFRGVGNLVVDSAVALTPPALLAVGLEKAGETDASTPLLATAVVIGGAALYPFARSLRRKFIAAAERRQAAKA